MSENLKFFGEHFKLLEKNFEVFKREPQVIWVSTSSYCRRTWRSLGENLKFLGEHFKLLEKSLEAFGRALQVTREDLGGLWARTSSYWASTSSSRRRTLRICARTSSYWVSISSSRRIDWRLLGENLKFLGEHSKLLEKHLEVFWPEPQVLVRALQVIGEEL